MPRKFPVGFEGSSIPAFGLDPNRLRVKKIPLDSARSDERIEMTGTFLYAIAASSKTVTMDLGFQNHYNDKLPILEGFFISGVRFDHVYIDNDAVSGGFITFLYGVEEQNDLRINNPASQFNDVDIITPTTLTPQDDVTCATAAATEVSAGASTKKETLIRHMNDNALDLRVGDSNVTATKGLLLKPGEQITIRGTSEIYCFNADAGLTESVSILEIHE